MTAPALTRRAVLAAAVPLGLVGVRRRADAVRAITFDGRRLLLRAGEATRLVALPDAGGGALATVAYGLDRPAPDPLMLVSDEFRFALDGVVFSGASGWRVRRLSKRGDTLEVTLSSLTGPVEVAVRYRAARGSSLIGKQLVITHRRDAPAVLTDVEMESFRRTCANEHGFLVHSPQRRRTSLAPFIAGQRDVVTSLHDSARDVSLVLVNPSVARGGRTMIAADCRTILLRQALHDRALLRPGEPFVGPQTWTAIHPGAPGRRLT